MGPEVSIVVPVYRNADTLEELHRRVIAALGRAGARHEFLFVDDACPAGSLAVLRRLAARDPRVAILSLASIPVERQAHPGRPSAYTGSMRLRVAWRAVRTAVRQPRAAARPGRSFRAPVQVREYIGARFGQGATATPGERSR